MRSEAKLTEPQRDSSRGAGDEGKERRRRMAFCTPHPALRATFSPGRRLENVGTTLKWLLLGDFTEAPPVAETAR